MTTEADTDAGVFDAFSLDNLTAFVEGFGQGAIDASGGALGVGATATGSPQEAIESIGDAADSVTGAVSGAIDDVTGRLNGIGVGFVDAVDSTLRTAKTVAIVTAALVGLAIIAWIIASVSRVVA